MRDYVARRFEFKEVSEDGSFAGYGSVFGNVDDGLDIVAEGAFSSSLKDWKNKGAMPPVLWQHKASEPIGVYTKLKEDKHGLEVEGKLIMKVSRAAEAYELMKAKAISGLSIGFMSREDIIDHKTGIRTIKQADLWEISIVTFPMNDKARVSSVKSIEEIETERDLEHYLRDAGGFSRTDACALVRKFVNAAEKQRDSATERAALLQSIQRNMNFLRG